MVSKGWTNNRTTMMCNNLSNRTLCSDEGVKLESNGENWVKYAMIRYKTNKNSTLLGNLHNTLENDDIRVINSKYQHMR